MSVNLVRSGNLPEYQLLLSSSNQENSRAAIDLSGILEEDLL